MTPADRFRSAQSWWIGSELCRRNPLLSMRTGLTGPGEVSLVRSGSSSVYGPIVVNLGDPTVVNGVAGPGWDAYFGAEGPHDIVKRLEGMLGGSPAHAPSTSAKTLMYRLLAYALNETVNGRHRVRVYWSAGYDKVGALDAFSTFPGAHEHIETRIHIGSSEAPVAHCLEWTWVLELDGRPLLMLDEGGWMHDLAGKRKHLFPLYTASHDIRTVFDKALRAQLPLG